MSCPAYSASTNNKCRGNVYAISISDTNVNNYCYPHYQKFFEDSSGVWDQSATVTTVTPTTPAVTTVTPTTPSVYETVTPSAHPISSDASSEDPFVTVQIEVPVHVPAERTVMVKRSDILINVKRNRQEQEKITKLSNSLRELSQLIDENILSLGTLLL